MQSRLMTMLRAHSPWSVDDESKAYRASRMLNQLDADGSIWIYAEAIVSKNNDGRISVKD